MNGGYSWTSKRGEFIGKGKTKGRAFLNMLNNEKRALVKEGEIVRVKKHNKRAV